MSEQPKMKRDSRGRIREILYRNCVNCGKSYATITKDRRYCSEACSRETASRNMRKKHICPHCHAIFHSRDSRRIYCSKKCREIDWERKVQLRDRHFWFIMNRDNFTCQYCGKNPTEDDIKLAFDHIKPRSDGGRDTLDNLVTACKHCNSMKRARPLRHEAEFRKRIQRRTGSLQTAFSFMIRS